MMKRSFARVYSLVAIDISTELPRRGLMSRKNIVSLSINIHEGDWHKKKKKNLNRIPTPHNQPAYPPTT